MNSETIFEIPIYSMSEKEFDEKWEERISKDVKKIALKGHAEEEAWELAEYLTFEKRIWKFNRIIGYILISVCKQDIWFDLYLSDIQKFSYLGVPKPCIQNQNLLGYHFRTVDLESNIKIRLRIIQELKKLIKQHVKKKYYVEMNIFNRTIDYIDFLDIQKRIK